MSDCFPPVPLYIVPGIILAMFTTVTSNIVDVDVDVEDGSLQFGLPAFCWPY